jgi:hypothetical protein
LLRIVFIKKEGSYEGHGCRCNRIHRKFLIIAIKPYMIYWLTNKRCHDYFANFDITGIFLLSLIIGGMFFFEVIMTPLVFTKFPPEVSGPFIRQTFPVYSQAMAGMTLAAALFLWNFSESIHLVILFIWGWLLPRINRHRDNQFQGNKNSETTFNLLHRLGVVVNVSQMELVGYVLYRVIIQI